MSACPNRQELQFFLNDQLSGKVEPAVLSHIDGCRGCQAALETLTAAAHWPQGIEPTDVPDRQSPGGQHGQPADQPGDAFWQRLRTATPNQASALAEKWRRTAAFGQDGDQANADGSLALPDLPRHLGQYEILRQLGRGGMAVVYLARQVPLNRLVALKVILGGVHASPEVRERFRSEAESVARLKHPHIVQIYEIGHHEGLWYLALEYVEGGTLAARLDGHPLPPRDGARLVELLARAIHYAHQHGVIHRDLKPANILLGSGGVVSGEWSKDQGGTTHHSPVTTHQPKIADFGLAKQLEKEDGQTQTGIAMGTPSYMAPEQAAGRSQAVTAATDVYALGAILYELLTGRPPLQGTTAHSTLAQVLTQEPVPPHRLQPHVPRDLETICLKCLQKEPQRRYASALDLADDLHAFQEGRPIRARPISQLERAWKWARRRPALTGLSAVVAFLALAVVVVSVIFALHSQEAVTRISAERENTETQRLQAVSARTDAEKRAEEANQARREAEAISAFFRGLLSQADIGAQELSIGQLERNPKVTVRELLDRAEKQIAGKFKDHPLTEAAVRQTLGETYRALGLFAQAQPHAERAVALRSALLGPAHPDTLDSKGHLAGLYQDQGKYALAEPIYQEVLAACMAELAPTDTRTLGAKNNLASLHLNQGQLLRAEAGFQDVLPVFISKLGADHPKVLICKNNLATAYRRQEKYSQAEPLLREVIAASTARLGADHPITLIAKDDLAAVYTHQQKYVQAEPLFEEVLAANIAKRGADHPLTLNTKNNLAKLYLEQQRYDRTEPLFREVLAARMAQSGADHPDTLISKNNLAFLLHRQKKYDDAEPLYREVVAAFTAKLGHNHLNTLHARNNLGLLYLEQGKDKLAEPLLAKALSDAQPKLGWGHPLTQRLAPRQLGVLYEHLQTPEKAEAVLRELVEFQKQQSGLDAATYAGDLGAFGSILLAQQKWSEAETVLRDCLAIRAKLQPDDWTTFSTKALLGSALLGQGRFADAEPILLQGYEGMKAREARTPPPGKTRLARTLERLVQLYDAWGQSEKATQWRKQLEPK